MLTELATELVDVDERLDIDTEDLDRLLDIAAWRVEPWFPVPGRTAWNRLERFARFRHRPGITFRSAKIKGVGLWNPDGDTRSPVRLGCHSSRARPPATDEYEPTTRLEHVGVSADGELVRLKSEPAPVGGMLLDRAQREHANAARLIDHGVPSFGPAAVVRYPELTFRGEPMGAAITLSPATVPYRAHVDYIDQHDETADYFLQLFKALGVDGDARAPYVQWRACEALYGRLGAVLRGFAEAGLYRYSAHLENLQFDLEHGELLLTDLDSSRALDELAPEIAALERVRDVSGALHKAAQRLHYFVMLDPLPLRQLLTVNPFAALLTGYLKNHDGGDDREIADAIEPLWRLVVPALYLRRRLLPHMLNWDRAAIRASEVDRDLFYVAAMTGVNRILADRDASWPLTPAALALKTRRFLGSDRSDYLAWIHRDSRLDSSGPMG